MLGAGTGAGFVAAGAFALFFSGVFAGAAGLAGVADFPALPRPALALLGAAFGEVPAFFDGFAFDAGLVFPALPEATFGREGGFALEAALLVEALAGAAFFAGAFRALAFVPAAAFAVVLLLPDLDAGRLERDAGLFCAALRAAVLAGFFPFTVAISQPFRKPLKMNGAI